MAAAKSKHTLPFRSVLFVFAIHCWLFLVSLVVVYFWFDSLPLLLLLHLHSFKWIFIRFARAPVLLFSQHCDFLNAHSLAPDEDASRQRKRNLKKAFWLFDKRPFVLHVFLRTSGTQRDRMRTNRSDGSTHSITLTMACVSVCAAHIKRMSLEIMRN